MLTDVQTAGLQACMAAARAAGHPFPGIAAAEGAVESATVAGGWFTSTNYAKHCNALGIKPWASYVGPVFAVPTQEWLRKQSMMPRDWKNARNASPAVRDGWPGMMWTIDAEFVHFASLGACFQAQMRILRGASYADAWQATTPEGWAERVSAVWATNPARGEMVCEIYHCHADLLGAPYASGHLEAASEHKASDGAAGGGGNTVSGSGGA